MYKVSLLDDNDGSLIYTINIPVIPRQGENITIESSSIKEAGFVTYEVDAVHYVHNPDNKKFSVVIYVKNVTN
jgi:hypothetical protein